MTVSLTKTKIPVDAERVDLTHIRSAIEDLDTVRSHLKALKDEEAELLVLVRAALGSASVGVVNGEDAVRAEERTNTSLNRDAIRTLLGPEVYGTVLKLTPYVAVSVVGKFRHKPVK